MKEFSWHSYIDANGDFELPSYLFRSYMHLMKQALDLGTLLSNDPAKLRAYKEQIKNSFKKRWFDVAQALEAFEIIVPCGCDIHEFCRNCGGSRFILNSALSPDELKEIAVITSPQDDPELVQKLRVGLTKALTEIQDLDEV